MGAGLCLPFFFQGLTGPDTTAERQPKTGTVFDQFPVIRIGDKYYTMSLRMMKAVW